MLQPQILGGPQAPIALAANEPDESDHRDDLLLHLERLDLVVQRAVLHTRHHADDRHDLEGLMQPQELIATPLTQLLGRPRWAMAEEAADVAHTPEPARTAGPGSKLQQLMTRFGLSPFERDLILLSLLPWFDARYALLFGYLQDDNDKPLPTVDLAMRLLGPQGWDRTQQMAKFSPQAPLLWHRLLRLQPKGEARHWGELMMQADRELYHHLAGHHAGEAQVGLPPPLAACARWLPAPDMPDYRPQLTERLARYCFSGDRQSLHGLDGPTRLLLLRGSTGSGRALALAHAGALADWPLLSVDLSLLPEDDQPALEVLLLALRETRLHGAGLVLRGLDGMPEARRWLFAQLSRRLAEHGWPVACLVEPHSPLVWLGDMPQWLVDMPERSRAADEAMLIHQIGHTLPGVRTAQDMDLRALVRRFGPSPDTVPHALREADNHRRQRALDAPLSQDDLCAAFRLRSQQNFGKLAQRITPARTFSDLIVGDELQQQLREILAAIRHREKVLEQGFGRKVSYGTGISALFHGDSGTGKTLVAEVLAGALGVDLIKIDLSTVVNKFIGETEKNLARIFDLAAADAGVLFFDEADALFGKRSETKDAQDRHANIEVSYLLQRLEAHPGLVVLATNNRSHLDEAFTRRLTFITRFPFPDAALRERMWRNIWPSGMAIDSRIDFARLSQKAPITGANIKNAAMLAAWLATDEGAPCIDISHVERALQRELEKLGRIAL